MVTARPRTSRDYVCRGGCFGRRRGVFALCSSTRQECHETRGGTRQGTVTTVTQTTTSTTTAAARTRSSKCVKRFVNDTTDAFFWHCAMAHSYHLQGKGPNGTSFLQEGCTNAFSLSLSLSRSVRMDLLASFFPDCKPSPHLSVHMILLVSEYHETAMRYY